MLEAKNISKVFYTPKKIEILKEISLKIHSEKSIAIMGSSGAGKSTLLHILSTLEKPDSGDLLFNQKPFQNIPKVRNSLVGFIFQSFFLIEHLSILQNVLMPAKIARQKTNSKSSSHRRALSLLEKVGLLERKDQLVKTLSGGEKQRVCIARALCNDPAIVFADEPTGNLDEETSKLIQKLLLETIYKEKKALVLVTHDEFFAAQCDHIYRLNEGRLVQLK